MSLRTADLCDEYTDHIDVCKQSFQSYGLQKQFYGPISTVKVFEDNVLVVEAIKEIPKGNVLVVDGGGSDNCALLGDNVADIAVKRKLSGIIIYGCVRDTLDLATMDIGILALGSHPKKSIKEGKGEKGTPVHFGEITWRPDDYVYVDEDGILVSDQALL